jgi:hypothetical protein
MTDDRGFIARVEGKNGNPLHITEPHPTRKAAADAAFKARPKANKCSTSKAYQGRETHNDIQFHERPTDRKQSMAESVALLLEDAFEKSELVAAAQSILTKLQDMAEKVASILPDDIMPIQDAMSERFGPQAAEQFNNVATQQMTGLVSAIQATRTAIGNEVLRLKKIANGESGSDAAMDADLPPSPDAPPAPDAETEAGATVDPTDADALNAAAGEDDEGAGPDEDLDGAPAQGSFAGREPKTEAFRRRGRRLREAAIAQPAFQSSMSSFRQFSPACATLADDVLDRIHHLAVNGSVRDNLAHVVRHIVDQANNPMVWDNPKGVAEMGLNTHFPQMPSAIDRSTLAAIDIVKREIERLAHKVAAVHEQSGMGLHERRVQKNILRLRESKHPDRVILSVFRRVLAECKSPTTAAAGTARAFDIDIGDVVLIIREAKKKVTPGFAKFLKKKKVTKEDVVPALMGKAAGKPDPQLVTAPASQIPPGQPPVPGQPVKPMTPADMRSRQVQQQRQDAADQAKGKPLQPIAAPTDKAGVTPVPTKGANMKGKVVSAADINKV